jgi:hypothetical protein
VQGGEGKRKSRTGEERRKKIEGKWRRKDDKTDIEERDEYMNNLNNKNSN